MLKAIRRTHAHYESAYYLGLKGRIVAQHSGKAGDPATTVGMMLGARALGDPSFGQDLIRKRNAAALIAAFEERLTSEAWLRAPNQGTPEPQQDPWFVLGLQPGASLDEVEVAFKAKSRENHPDLVAHMGPEIREVAGKRMVAINAAREELLRRFRKAV